MITITLTREMANKLKEAVEGYKDAGPGPDSTWQTPMLRAVVAVVKEQLKEVE